MGNSAAQAVKEAAAGRREPALGATVAGAEIDALTG
jgi:hypothetical protein